MTIEGDMTGLMDLDTSLARRDFVPEWLARFTGNMVSTLIEELRAPDIIFDTTTGQVEFDHGNAWDGRDVSSGTRATRTLPEWVALRSFEMGHEESVWNALPVVVNGINAQVRERHG